MYFFKRKNAIIRKRDKQVQKSRLKHTMQLFEGIFPNTVYISLEEYIIKQYLTITMKNIYLSIFYEKYLFTLSD